MDNLVEYLVAIIFIISFLSEMFKKKKKGGTTVPSSDSPKIKVDDNYSVPDSLDDIFKLRTQTNKPVPKKLNNYVSATLGKKDNYQDKRTFDRTTLGNSPIINSEESLIEKYERKKKLDSGIPTFAKQKPGQLKNETNLFADSTNQIKHQLFNHQSLRNYIVVSEILAKPLALRKKCQKIL
ncbi:MAG: hypothetical protein V1773_08845 [bacterium]